jgi:hypothetical protein
MTRPFEFDPSQDVGRSGLWSSMVSLFASSSTLLCCALPALLVALGAGAALSTVVSAVPQLVWLSENKAVLFTGAGLMLLASGALQWRNRHAPCPLNPALARSCQTTRRLSARIFGVSMALYAVGGWFAFVQPWFSAVD